MRFILFLILLGALFVSAPTPRAAASCAMAPGDYGGIFERRLETFRNAGSVAITVYTWDRGVVLLTIKDDCSVNGTFPNLLVTIRVHTAGALNDQTTCPFDGNGTFTGKVQVGKDGNPLLHLDTVTHGAASGSFKIDPVTSASFVCSGDGLKTILVDIVGLFDYGMVTSTASYDWQATFVSPDLIAGTAPWLTGEGAQAIQTLRDAGDVVLEKYHWQLQPKKKEQPLEVMGVLGKFESVFLEHIPVVLNEYEASVNWGDLPPGQVDFILGNTTTTVDAAGPFATAPILIDPLDANKHPLQIIARSGDKASPPFLQYNINVVPVPPWAKPFNLQAQDNAGFILYQGTRKLPAAPFEANIQLPKIIPYLGGTWGITPTQFDVTLSASSATGPSNGSITGESKLVIGAREIPISVRQEPQVTFIRTRMTEEALTFDSGAIRIEAPDTTYENKVGLLDLIPGAGAAFNIPVLGGLLKQLDVGGIGGAGTVKFLGDAKLGLVGDEFQVTGFDARSDIDVRSFVTVGQPKVASATALAGVVGTVEMEITPQTHLKGCKFSVYGYLAYFTFLGGGGTFPENPETQEITSCAGTNTLRFAPGHAAPVLQRASPLGLLLRSLEWKPEVDVSNPISETLPLSDTNGVETTLWTTSENANALLANPVLASSGDGRMALAWITENPDAARPRAFQLGVRVFDGKTWGAPIPITGDASPDYTPAVAFDGKGQIVVVWAQVTSPDFSANTPLDTALLQTTELASATLDAQSFAVKMRTSLTNDAAMDIVPQLAAARDGSVWLAWQTNNGAELVATTQSPTQLHAARWDGSQWSKPEIIGSNLTGALAWTLAARDNNTALVAVQSGESANRNVSAFERSAAGWQTHPLAQNVSGGANPVAAFTASGKPLVSWNQNGQFAGIVGDWSAAPVSQIKFDARPLAFLPRANGEIEMLLTRTNGRGEWSAWHSRWDGDSSSTWSAPEKIYDLPLAPTTTSAARVGDNAFAFALAAPAPRTRPVQLPGGQLLAIPDLPELAALEVLRVGTVSADAALAAGEAADLTVNVYAVTPFDIPADAPEGFQPGPGMRAVAVEFGIQNKKAGFLQTSPTAAKLRDAAGKEYASRATLLAFYEAEVCKCEVDSATYAKFVNGSFEQGEGARGVLVFTFPKDSVPRQLKVPYYTGNYTDETDAKYLSGKSALLLIDLPG